MKFLRLLLVPFAFATVLFVRFIYPWKHIRFGQIWASRIGHLIGNTECYLCEKDAGKHEAFDIFYPLGEPCNKVIYGKYRKRLHVWPAFFCDVVMKVGSLFRDWNKHTVSDTQFGRDIYNLWEKPHIGFTKAEEKRGQELLRELGIPEGAKWVCLIVRDGAYLKDLTYHDYRNSDIDTYKDAAIMLAAMGYYVIRMGSVVEKPFHVEHPMVIDYASGKRTEFGDLYLGAKCAFCISTGTGFDEIAHLFGRPICYVNMVPLEYAPTFAKGLLIWKHHIKDGKRLSPEEIYPLAGQSTFAHLFEQAGITLEDNTPQEISDVVMEMADRVVGTVPDIRHKEIHEDYLERHQEQIQFWKTFPRSISPYNNKPLHGEIKLRIGTKFLEIYSKMTK